MTQPLLRTQPRRAGAFVLALLLAAPAAASAQAQGPAWDFAGRWGSLTDEDILHRTMPGPDLGDYTGLPLNDAGRLKADSWDATVLSQLERQAQPHPATYSMRGPRPTLYVTEIHDDGGALVGYRVRGFYGRADRTIWMDGREHPSKYAEHTWAGFSTGRWENGRLVVTTTHIKMGVIQRNGSATSPYARMMETFTRTGDMLRHMSWVDDPIYLEEPMVRTQSWELQAPPETMGEPRPVLAFEPVEEVWGKPYGWVVYYPMGTEPRRFARMFGLPFEATRGGAASLYPEYQAEIERMMREAEAADGGR